MKCRVTGHLTTNLVSYMIESDPHALTFISPSNSNTVFCAGGLISIIYVIYHSNMTLTFFPLSV